MKKGVVVINLIGFINDEFLCVTENQSGWGHEYVSPVPCIRVYPEVGEKKKKETGRLTFIIKKHV